MTIDEVNTVNAFDTGDTLYTVDTLDSIDSSEVIDIHKKKTDRWIMHGISAYIAKMDSPYCTHVYFSLM